MQILSGHISEDTAYIVSDYPYGFRLRCKIRYWIEFDPKRGYRFCSQTTNPKKAGEYWNKPKKTTYAYGGMAMYVDEAGLVTYALLTGYSKLSEIEKWKDVYFSGLPEAGKVRLDFLIDLKRVYEAKMATGMDYRQAGTEAAIEVARRGAK